jgi:membrane protease YdiL (CAAX protease family)
MKRYLKLTKTHSYSLLFAFPLLLLYELGAMYTASTGSNLRNGADVMLQTLLALGGIRGTLAVAIIVMAVAAFLIIRERRKKKVKLKPIYFLGMTGESFLYALLLGIVVGTATQRILDTLPGALSLAQLSGLPMSEAIVLSLGAGIYEELVFRVLLVGGLFAALRGAGLGENQAGAIAIVASSLVFSGFHYIGPYGDAWVLSTFLFRFLAGLAFSLLFLTRGFGIAAWSHALYDLILVVAIGL